MGPGVGVGGLFWGRSGWQFEGIRGGVAPGVLFNGLPAFGTPVLIKAVFFDRDCLILLDTES